MGRSGIQIHNEPETITILGVADLFMLTLRTLGFSQVTRWHLQVTNYSIYVLIIVYDYCLNLTPNYFRE